MTLKISAFSLGIPPGGGGFDCPRYVAAALAYGGSPYRTDRVIKSKRWLVYCFVAAR
jgi:hypothetical protein